MKKLFQRVKDSADRNPLRNVFTCNVEFYIYMFGHSYSAITRPVELTGYHNTKF